MWQAIVERIRSEFGGTLSSAADWALSAALLVGAGVAAWLLHAGILALARRLSGERRPYLRSVLEATKYPTRVALLLVALAIALSTAPLAPVWRDDLLGGVTVITGTFAGGAPMMAVPNFARYNRNPPAPPFVPPPPRPAPGTAPAAPAPRPAPPPPTSIVWMRER